VPVRRTISEHEQIRRRRGLTITELARRAGFSRPYMSRVEGGLQKASPRYRSAVAKALGVPEELIFGERESGP
jgi:transcriptional regulator with XRE-family HTH domain